MELTDAINRVAGPGHDRWGWSIGEGMNTLLVHIAGARAALATGLEAAWHPQAQVAIGETEVEDEAATAALVKAATMRV